MGKKLIDVEWTPEIEKECEMQVKERRVPTNLPHRWYRFYKNRYEKKECVVGVKRLDLTRGVFWLVGFVEEVGFDSLLLRYLDGTVYPIHFDDIIEINWYSSEYFKRKGIPDPKLRYEQEQKETVKRKYEEYYGGRKN